MRKHLNLTLMSKLRTTNGKRERNILGNLRYSFKRGLVKEHLKNRHSLRTISKNMTWKKKSRMQMMRTMNQIQTMTLNNKYQIQIVYQTKVYSSFLQKSSKSILKITIPLLRKLQWDSYRGVSLLHKRTWKLTLPSMRMFKYKQMNYTLKASPSLKSIVNCPMSLKTMKMKNQSKKV